MLRTVQPDEALTTILERIAAVYGHGSRDTLLSFLRARAAGAS